MQKRYGNVSPLPRLIGHRRVRDKPENCVSRQSLAISRIARQCPNRFKPGTRDDRTRRLETHVVLNRSTPGFPALFWPVFFQTPRFSCAKLTSPTGTKIGHATFVWEYQSKFTPVLPRPVGTGDYVKERPALYPTSTQA
jgi:hypothetical protein